MAQLPSATAMYFNLRIPCQSGELGMTNFLQRGDHQELNASSPAPASGGRRILRRIKNFALSI
jgi:hypothetical protein